MSDSPSASPLLSAVPRTSAWASFASRTFGPTGLTEEGCRLAILPVHGGGDHGLGLSADVEEVICGAVLQDALSRLPASGRARVLPPLRQALDPHQDGLAGIDPETLHEVLQEIAAGVKAAGFERLLFLTTNPWNGELIDAASRDVRVALELQTFVIGLAGIGLNLHPASADRLRAQAAAAIVLGQNPAVPDSTNAPVPIDTGFRPGNWRGAPAATPDPHLDGAATIASAGETLAGLMLEIMTRPGLGFGIAAPKTELVTRATTPANAPRLLFPASRRFRYLPALPREELRTLPDQERSLVILPIGAIEQHGPHLPVGVDAFLGEATCAALADRLPRELPVWFGPSLPFGKSNEHLDFPGTISLSARTLRRLVLAQIEALYGCGFRQFALLNTHGGNSAVLIYTLREIQHRWGVRAGMLKIPAPSELSPQEAMWGFHAGEWETSLMLALAPELVDMEQALRHYPARLEDPGSLRPENAPAIFSWMTRDIAPDGVMGDATAATAEKGRRWFDAAMDDLTAQVIALVRSPR